MLTLVGRALQVLEWSTGAISHAQARPIVAEAYRRVFGTEATVNALQIAQGVSIGESHYGQDAFKNLETGTSESNTNNWAAQQCGKMKPPCEDPCFESTDSDAKGVRYQGCFRRFDTPEEGAEGFMRVLYEQRPTVLAAANRGDVDLVAAEMRRTGYYQAPLTRYRTALNRNVDAVAKALGEPRATPPSFGRGSRLWPWAPIALLTGAIFYGTIRNRSRTRRRR